MANDEKNVLQDAHLKDVAGGAGNKMEERNVRFCVFAAQGQFVDTAEVHITLDDTGAKIKEKIVNRCQGEWYHKKLKEGKYNIETTHGYKIYDDTTLRKGYDDLRFVEINVVLTE